MVPHAQKKSRQTANRCLNLLILKPPLWSTTNFQSLGSVIQIDDELSLTTVPVVKRHLQITNFHEFSRIQHYFNRAIGYGRIAGDIRAIPATSSYFSLLS